MKPTDSDLENRRPSRAPTIAAPMVAVVDKLRWSATEAAAMCGISRDFLYELLKADEFPPRAHAHRGEDDAGGKLQFIASEVRAWADGRDWRALVAARQEVACAS